MNKYLLEVEAIQFTGDNAKEFEKRVSKECGIKNILKKCDIEKGDYIVFIPKKDIFDGYFLTLMSEREFEVYARRFY